MDNIVLKKVSNNTITVAVNGQFQEIQNRLDALQLLLKKQSAQTFQAADKIYNINSISSANFDYITAQTRSEKSLPPNVVEDLITNKSPWINSLKQELRNRQGVPVSMNSNPSAIFQYYGWLIEEFLRKMATPVGQKPTLRRLSFMSEVFQGSLRYLCFIQIAQLLKVPQVPIHPLLSDFFQLKGNQYFNFDYVNLLLVVTNLLPAKSTFMPQINTLVAELSNPKSDLYGTILFLEKYRHQLWENKILENDHLEGLLDEYLTGLVFWLRKISFLAKFRLVSIKDISLKYRLGMAKYFVHFYGELHGIYSEAYGNETDYNEIAVKDLFTFNHSVLLFNGSRIEGCLDDLGKEGAYISLSPLIIDHSVYSDKLTQTPEIYYYAGSDHLFYQFAQYKNELPFDRQKELPSNKMLEVKSMNIYQPKLDELFEQMEQILSPFKSLNK